MRPIGVDPIGMGIDQKDEIIRNIMIGGIATSRLNAVAVRIATIILALVSIKNAEERDRIVIYPLNVSGLMSAEAIVSGLDVPNGLSGRSTSVARNAVFLPEKYRLSPTNPNPYLPAGQRKCHCTLNSLRVKLNLALFARKPHRRQSSQLNLGVKMDEMRWSNRIRRL
jgi:hypothetical protein